jgi:hypothetical protein
MDYGKRLVEWEGAACRTVGGSVVESEDSQVWVKVRIG